MLIKLQTNLRGACLTDVRVRRDRITQRGLGGFTSSRNLSPPELPPDLSGGLGSGSSGQQSQLTAKDLVGSALPPESASSLNC